MALIPPSEGRDVRGISDHEKTLIKTFMQGAVYSWIKNQKDKSFSVRDLMGGENFEWEGTPLQVLYEKHLSKGKSNTEAIEAAAKDLGWLVKTVLIDDKRTFTSDISGLVRSYCWIGNEP
jgi:hypothetical protein